MTKTERDRERESESESEREGERRWVAVKNVYASGKQLDIGQSRTIREEDKTMHTMEYIV